MTDALSSEAAMRSLASLKPAPIPTPAAKPPEKPAAATPAETPPPPPGSKTFLGWVASSFSKKQIAIGVAAVASLAAGIAAVKFLTPPADDQSQLGAMSQPLLSNPANPDAPAATLGPPKVSVDPKPGEFIPPGSFPIIPATSPTGAYPAVPPPPSSLDTSVTIPPVPATSLPASLPPIPGASPAPSSAVPPPPESLVPAVIPASGFGGDQPGLPQIPAGPSATLPATGGTLPAQPISPASPAALPPIPSASTPTTGTKPPPPDPVTLVPDPKSPPAPTSLPLIPPVGASAPAGGSTPLPLTRPAENPTATPRAPTTSFDVDIYQPKKGEKWEDISREFYNDTKYAAALQAYNASRPQQDGKVDVPPIHILRKMTPAPVPGTVIPASRTGTDAWGSATGGSTTGARTYTVPAGGLGLQAVARLVLGTEQRWKEIWELNPSVAPDKVPAGTELKLPPDARVP